MNKWRNIVTRAGAFAIAGLLALSTPMAAKAWDLNGESTQTNDIKTKNPSSLITTIQTNFHAGGVTGFVVLTPSASIDAMLGITEDMQTMGARGIIYIADTNCGEKAAEIFKNETAKVQGEILRYFDIQFFKNDGTWNEPQTTLSSPVRMAIGIGESDRSSSYDYAMIRLHDGAATLLKDLDDDEYTITFESDKFSTYAMIRYPKGTEVKAETPAQKPAEEAPQGNTAEGTQQESQPAGTGTAAPSAPALADQELDDVPKTGDSSGKIGSLFIFAGAGMIVASLLRMKRKRDKASRS